MAGFWIEGCETNAQNSFINFFSIHVLNLTCYVGLNVQSDLIYPDSLVAFNMSSDCQTSGLLNHFKNEMVENLPDTVRIVRCTV